MIRSHVFNRTLSAIVLVSLVAGCSGGGSSMPGPTPSPVPTPSPTPVSTGGSGTGSGGGTNAAAYTCPSSDSVSSIARTGTHNETGSRRAGVYEYAQAQKPTGLIAVTYSGSQPDARTKSIAASRESAAGASLLREISYSHVNRYQRILRVTPGTEAAAIAKLRAQSGVVEATMTGLARHEMTVAAKYFTNDTYYNGFTQAQLTASGDAAAPTYHVDPYEESSSVPGQWGMHAVRLDYAEAYSQSGNGSGITNGGALGSSGVKIAVIDSGQDSSHPELNSKIVQQRCFLTNPSTNVRSSSNFSVDQDGHGTDVSGIAGAAINNSLGFVGSGGNSSILGYQVFPMPDDSCVVGGTDPDNQCGASTLDIADAIGDAVKSGAAVINLSLGGGTCTNGADPDTAEGTAVADAIAANVVVVAAAGNDATSTPATIPVSSPACDTGVIAVGASALSDGLANGSSSSPSGSASAPTEYVASYSEYGSPAAAPGSASAWGIVAPGGDPSKADADPNATTTDELHWIDDIWTSTPYDTKFEADCGGDLGNPVSGNALTGTPDCRTLIAGTSQATPVVAGAVALIIAANNSYASASKMKSLLCTTAHDIGDPHEGCGRLDIYRAMATALSDPNPPASK